MSQAYYVSLISRNYHEIFQQPYQARTVVEVDEVSV